MTSSTPTPAGTRSCAGTCPNPCSPTGTSAAAAEETRQPCPASAADSAPQHTTDPQGSAGGCCGPQGCGSDGDGCNGNSTYLPGVSRRTTQLLALAAAVFLLVGVFVGHVVGAVLIALVALVIAGPLARGLRYFSLPERVLRLSLALLLGCIALWRW